MPLELIHDSEDPRLADYRNLTDTALRRMKEPEHGLYIAESVKVIARAVQAGHTPRSVLTQRKWVEQVEQVLAGRDTAVYLVTDDMAERVTGYAVHRGALASMHRPVLPTVAEVLRDVKLVPPHPESQRTARSRVAVLEGLTDHANVGSAFRNAAALGVDAVLVTPSCADPFYRRAVRVSMGTVFQVPWTRIENWPAGIVDLQAAGYIVAGMTLGEGAITLDRLVEEDHEKLALIFGTEGDGIASETDRRLDRRVTIPMMGGVDSLNVAAASAVVFHATR
ncbi:RNA methyltransferase [Microbacterium sp. AK031]|uniref:TrmH family RNA methyltransferase n=1 Tax=Microbacterium sp. AK031 TaxID=2723076 RepID=UPI00216989F8|nr:RNA methyltransferase [Microbacterium sp. AK031]MCS3842453.1 tRNA G18 (ribose-2'-O)-methylase SpoU [Microbacterium sp. AK031]